MSRDSNFDSPKGGNASVEQLLSAERALPGVPGDVQARLAARISASTGIAVGAVGLAASAGSGAASASAAAAVGQGGATATGAAAVAGSTVASGAAVTASASVGAKLIVAAAISAAAVGGVAVVARIENPRNPPTSNMSDPATTQHVGGAPSAESRPTTSVAGPEPTAHGIADAGPPGASRLSDLVDASPPSSGQNFAAERRLVGRARLALTEGDSERALSYLREHRRRFRRGRLAEERDALTIGALSAAGRQRDAAQAARQFLRRYPRSLYKKTATDAIE